MHPLILASGECTPVLGLYFEKKLMSFGEVIGEDEYFLDAHKLESSVEVLAVFEDLWQKRAQIRARLATCRDRLLRSSEMNLKLLGDLLER
jgi:polysaccharide pyruvyl transferase WcaK-like protein